ncbi:hypothetical protein E4V51_07525 [Paenibacillus sp. 28ISP30-2]|uniref:Uncharacterized protein n=1 Tax=Paenibacillus terrae TaxID=159743 RepID=A0A0D7WUZ1_9BACL|nr:hypothetical protein [Paenibacillus terrae]KJD42538.1 hypothetical protein QD47_27690 [Paenibacillus terrae]MBE0341091.1 hypothetical protein [Paenibacillus sp. 28ISP30-2]
MFYDTKLEILDAEFIPIRSMMADVQPYRKSFSFEDGYTLETTYRAFCTLVESLLQSNRYVQIGKDVFIILDMKEWSDYMELYLYRCKPDFALEVEE